MFVKTACNKWQRRRVGGHGFETRYVRSQAASQFQCMISEGIHPGEWVQRFADVCEAHSEEEANRASEGAGLAMKLAAIHAGQLPERHFTNRNRK